MADHHAALKALGPVDWDQIPRDDLEPFLNGLLTDAHTIIESIPTPSGSRTQQRARAQTDSAINIGDAERSGAAPLSSDTAATARQLRKEWKEVKVSPADNPLDVNVYKLAAKDGKGAWFARRSVHEGIPFDKWKAGFENELLETLKDQKTPGTGSIRGIGAESRVEHEVVPNIGYLDVFQLYVQFTGPTSPRDFITFLLGSDLSHLKKTDSSSPRQFMLLSKPCSHPDAPPRQGIIRGQYESVEFVREIPLETPLPRRSFSSTDVAHEGGAKTSATADGPSSSHKSSRQKATAIEWMMVTRSDPGGSVPRFLIERGTPPSIAKDAKKFWDWLSSKPTHQLLSLKAETDALTKITTGDVPQTLGTQEPQELEGGKETKSLDESQQSTDADATVMNDSNNSGIYSMVTGAFGAASTVATGLRRQFLSPNDDPATQPEPTPRSGAGQEDETDTASDTSSIGSFTSALEKRETEDQSIASLESDDVVSQSIDQQDKDLKKLQERRRKYDEKVVKMQERMAQKRQEGKAKDDASWAKAREKHEREIAKQEAKYQRELKRLEEKREQEQRKKEERKRRAAEKEEKAKGAVELERVKAERDQAQQQIKLLQGQVGELQAQNTMLVAKLGRLQKASSTSSQDLGTGSSRPASPALS